MSKLPRDDREGGDVEIKGTLLFILINIPRYWENLLNK